MSGFGKISFNAAYAKKIGKERFIKEFKPVYPGVDLAKEYDKVVPKEKKEKEDK